MMELTSVSLSHLGNSVLKESHSPSLFPDNLQIRSTFVKSGRQESPFMVHLLVPRKHHYFTFAGVALVLEQRVLRLQDWITCQGIPADKPHW